MRYFSIVLAVLFITGLGGCAAPSNGEAGEDVASASAPEIASEAISIYDAAPPTINAYMSSPAMLIFSKTRAWRHEDGIAGGNLFFNRLAKDMGYGILTTQNGAIFNDADLAKFRLVVLNSFTGDALSPAQEAALERWTQGGGALIAIHGSGDSSHGGFPWYHETVLGTTFISHPMAPQFQAADVHTLALAHPVMAGIPAVWSHTEEWYTFDRVPGDNFVLLAGVDEGTYSPVNTVYGDISDLRMGPEPSDHPIIWARCINQGRSVYSALGHLDTAFDVTEHQRILRNAIEWTTKTVDPDGQHCAAQ